VCGRLGSWACMVLVGRAVGCCAEVARDRARSREIAISRDLEVAGRVLTRVLVCGVQVVPVVGAVGVLASSGLSGKQAGSRLGWHSEVARDRTRSRSRAIWRWLVAC
jgi:hypothetical protein